MHRRLQTALLLGSVTVLVACLEAAAQGTGQSAGENADTGIVAGHVFCADTQKPARFVTLRLQPVDGQGARAGRPAFATTASDGSFRIPGVAPGEYYAVVNMPGYIQPMRGRSDDLQQMTSAERDRLTAQLTRVTVTANQSVTAQVTIYRGATISGSVSFDDGSPASGVPVQAYTASPDSSTSSQAAQVSAAPPHQFGGSAMTDDRGQFRMAGLSGGVYTVQAAPRSIFPVFFGNTIDPQGARKLDLHTGDDTTGIDIIVPATGMHRVSGIVASQRDGHALAHASVHLQIDSSQSGSGATIGAISGTDGTFVFNAVPDGKFEVQLANAYDNTTHTGYTAAAQKFEVNGSDVTDLVINATPQN